MTRERHQRISNLFLAACELCGEERGAYLEKACAGDEEARAEVEAMLASDEVDLWMPAQSPEPVSDEHHAGNETRSIPRSKSLPQDRRFPAIEGYRILSVVGRGGMGVVYRAVQTKLDRTVALKVLPAIVRAASPSAVARFRREATAAARLHHTNIVPIYDFGESRDTFYYAMELIEGQPMNVLIRSFSVAKVSTLSPTRLAEILQSRHLEATDIGDTEEAVQSTDDATPSTSSTGHGKAYYLQVARWMADTADALHYAHGQGIIHRDIKPHNLILATDGRTMIADFGLAKTRGEESMTLTGSLIGTLRYISPEQAMAKRVEVDHRTDIYSLGVTMYELLSLRPAFPGEDHKRILGAIIARDPTSLRKLVPTVPRELETICFKAMEKDPDSRYSSARVMAEDLRRYASDLPIVARRAGVARRTVKFIKRHRSAALTVTSFVLLILFSIVFIQDRRAAEVERTRAEVELKNKEVESLVADAKSHVLLEKWEDAAEELRGALSINPYSVKALLTRAWMNLEHDAILPARNEELLQAAIEDSQRVLDLDPSNDAALSALNFRGVALRRRGDLDEAAESFERAARLAPDSYEVHSNLGTTYAIMGEFGMALEYLTKGIELAQIDETETGSKYCATAWRNLAALELHLKDEAAAEHAELARKCDQDDLPTLILRARIALEIPDLADLPTAEDWAIAAHTRAEDDDTLPLDQRRRANRIRALAHLRNGAFENAITHSRSALQRGDMATVNHLIIAAAEARLGHRDTAKEHLRKAGQEWPPDLVEAGAYRATAEKSVLWIESADQLIALRGEVEALIAAEADGGANP